MSSASRSRRCTGASRAPSRSPTCSRCSSSPRSRSRRRGCGCRARRRSSSASSLRSCSCTSPATSTSRDSDALAQWGKGMTKWLIHFAFLACGGRLARPARAALLLADARLVQRRDRRQRRLRRAAAARRAAGRQPRRERALTDHGRREPDQRLRRDQRRECLSPERADGRPEPPRDHVDRPAARPDAALPAARAHPSVAALADADDRLPALRRGGDALAQRPARARRRRAGARGAVPAAPAPSRAARADRRCAGRAARDRALAQEFLHDRAQVARADERRLGERALPGLQLHPARACTSTRCSASD